jgi:hypothetical protein
VCSFGVEIDHHTYVVLDATTTDLGQKGNDRFCRAAETQALLGVTSSVSGITPNNNKRPAAMVVWRLSKQENPNFVRRNLHDYVLLCAEWRADLGSLLRRVEY